MLNGQIIANKDRDKNEIIKFEQLTIDLSDVNTNTIKSPKLQETSTFQLLNCLIKKNISNPNCDARNEVINSLNRRIVLPFYIPVIALICSMLMTTSKRKYFDKNIIFFYSFILLVFVELTVRYTGINNFLLYIFLISPLVLSIFLYSFFNFHFFGNGS